MASLFRLALAGLLHSRLTFGMLVVAVAAGVGFQIPNAANLDGYSAELFEQGVVRVLGHVVISPQGSQPIDDARALAARLARLDGVNRVTLRQLHAGILFRRETNLPVKVLGLVPEEEQPVNGFCDRLAAGVCLTGGPDQVVLGAALAERLEAAPGDRLRLVLPVQGLGGVEVTRLKVTVAGVLRGGGGFSGFDQVAFVRLDSLWQVLGWDDAATSLHVYLDQPDEADAVAARAASLLAGAALKVEPWWQVDSFVRGAIEGNRTIAGISTTMVVLAVLIPVLALLFIHVLSERRQIATLAAIGFSGADLFAIYLLRAALVAALGVVLGVAIGLGLCAWFEAYPIFEHQGFSVRPLVSVSSVAVPVGVIGAVTLLGGLLPAIKAARANPSLQMREE